MFTKLGLATLVRALAHPRGSHQSPNEIAIRVPVCLDVWHFDPSRNVFYFPIAFVFDCSFLREPRCKGASLHPRSDFHMSHLVIFTVSEPGLISFKSLATTINTNLCGPQQYTKYICLTQQKKTLENMQTHPKQRVDQCSVLGLSVEIVYNCFENMSDA